MLEQKNGFYAFEYALHAFPLTGDPETGLDAWNAGSLWRDEYQDLAEGLLFFAEDIFEDQFCLSKKHGGVHRFHAETGQTTLMAASVEEWAEVILSNYKIETGWPLAHEWQEKNGRLPLGKRLMPKTPFFLGGEYRIENLWAGNPLEGMRFKAYLAVRTRDLPDGEKVRIILRPQPQ
ncbi:MAG: SMI1/KNR4 family protein [Acidobacteria bacterium]|nr:SMI1/KNR4 family protein [Acidobacteriota bacterium]